MSFWITYLLGIPFRFPLALLTFLTPRSFKDLSGLVLLVVLFPLGIPIAVFHALRMDFVRCAQRRVKPFEERARAAAMSASLYLGEALRFTRNDPTPLWDERNNDRVFLAGIPIGVPVRSMTSALFLGSPGSGKTTGALGIAAQFVLTHKRPLVVYVDLKGDDPEIYRTLKYFAESRGLKFHYVSDQCGEPSHALNPLEELAEAIDSPSAFASVLCSTLGIAEGSIPYWRIVGEEGVGRGVALDPEASSFARLQALFSDRTNEQLYPTDKDYQDLGGLRSVIRTLGDLPQFNVSKFDSTVHAEVGEHRVSARRLAETGGVVYVRLRHEHRLAPLVVRGFYEAVRRANSGAAERTHALLLCDELHRALKYSPDIFSSLIALSRSASLLPVFIAQNLSQIRADGGDALVGELLDIPVVLYFGGSDTFTNETLKREWGTELFQTQSATGIQTYTRFPKLREELFMWLCTAANATHCFIGRVARRKEGFYTVGKATPPTDLTTYEEFKRKGWPSAGEFEGAMVAERRPVFHSKTETNAEETKRPASSHNAAIAEVLGQFAEKARKGARR